MFIFAHPAYLHGVRVKFVYEGHRVKVKVTGARKCRQPSSILTILATETCLQLQIRISEVTTRNTTAYFIAPLCIVVKIIVIAT